MNQTEIESFVAALENVQREDSYGYGMFYIGEERIMPFVSTVDSDNEYDDVSNLDRDGVFRINIGVSRKTFEALFGDEPAENVDYSLLNTFLPHPHYAKQHFICILNPEGENVESTKTYINEAHDIATAQYQRRKSK